MAPNADNSLLRPRQGFVEWRLANPEQPSRPSELHQSTRLRRSSASSVANGGVGNTISQNSIDGNVAVSIDLGNTGVPSTNSSAGAHTGPYQL